MVQFVAFRLVFGAGADLSAVRLHGLALDDNWEAINLSLARKRPDVKGASGVSFSRKVSAETFGLYQ